VTERLELRVEGMNCASCVAAVERSIGKLRGVGSATVNLATERVAVDYASDTVSPSRIKAAIREAGYRPVDLDLDRDRDARESGDRGLRLDLGVAVAATLPLLVLAMGPMLVPALHLEARAWQGLELLLATAVQLFAGRRFYRQAWAELPSATSVLMPGAAWRSSAQAWR